MKGPKMPAADRKWLAAFGDEKRAELDRSHVVICTLPNGERVIARGEGFLSAIVDERRARTLRVNFMAVPSMEIAEALREVLASRPAPPPPVDWASGG
jgi:hypothetical protein